MDSSKNCNNNLIGKDGEGLQVLNVIFWFLIRFTINYAATIAMLILFWKPILDKKKNAMYYRNQSMAEQTKLDFFEENSMYDETNSSPISTHNLSAS